MTDDKPLGGPHYDTDPRTGEQGLTLHMTFGPLPDDPAEAAIVEARRAALRQKHYENRQHVKHILGAKRTPEEERQYARAYRIDMLCPPLFWLMKRCGMPTGGY